MGSPIGIGHLHEPGVKLRQILAAGLDIGHHGDCMEIAFALSGLLPHLIEPLWIFNAQAGDIRRTGVWQARMRCLETRYENRGQSCRLGEHGTPAFVRLHLHRTANAPSHSAQG